jgi:membrane associated rhomboid family serine protease
MIPLHDVSRRPLHFPVATSLIIGINVAVFILELVGGETFIKQWSMVPAYIVAGHNWITIFSAMFLHGGLIHILGNMLFLWVFGPEVEDIMGIGRYLIFYLLGGLVATFAQIIVDPSSTIPNLGASGAIAAVMGAFIITYPRDRIRTVLIIGWFIIVRFIPAVFLIGFWFLIQLFSEVGGLVKMQRGGVAYMAHIGGFIFGMVTVRIFEDRQRRAQRSRIARE